MGKDAKSGLIDDFRSPLRLVFDEQLFREALALYEGTHDFTEFCKAHSRGRVVERVRKNKIE